MVVLCVVLVSLYALLFFVYLYGWYTVPVYQSGTQSGRQATRISVVVAARNESTHIESCIKSLLSQNYPPDCFELIIVDDHSEDDTAYLVGKYAGEQLRLLSLAAYISPTELPVSYKKKAISVGVKESKGELIVLTDADCVHGPDWLSEIDAFYQAYDPKMIVAPVAYLPPKAWFSLFQSIDFAMMQGITAAVVKLDLGVMCNGANLAFPRSVFDAVKGYEGHEHIISGDDYLLQLKIKQMFPDGVMYLKSPKAIVYTHAQDGLKAFIRQRVRWASKTGKYKDTFMTYSLLLVYLTNLVFLCTAIAACFSPTYQAVLVFIFIEKLVLELLLLQSVMRFFGRSTYLWAYPFLQPVHIIYIILAGFLSRISRFEWKSRINHQQ